MCTVTLRGHITPTTVMEVLLSLTLISLFIQQKANLTVARLVWDLDRCRTCIGSLKAYVSSKLYNIKTRFPELVRPCDIMPATYCFDRHFEKHFLQRSEWVNGKSSQEWDIAIYTDRSKADDVTGAGITKKWESTFPSPEDSVATVLRSQIFATIKIEEILDSKTK